MDINSHMNKSMLCTSHINYIDEGRVDITAKSGNPIFAPEWKMVNLCRLEQISVEQFIDYYVDKLNQSVKTYTEDWIDLLSMEKIVLCCYCKPSEFCHRYVLAEYIHRRFGIEYLGEIVKDYIIF